MVYGLDKQYGGIMFKVRLTCEENRDQEKRFRFDNAFELRMTITHCIHLIWRHVTQAEAGNGKL